MKNLFLFALISIFSTEIYAQFGFTANYLTATPEVSGEGFSLEGESFSGYGVGVTYLVAFSDKIDFRPELMYVSFADSEFSTGYSSLMLPVPAMYHITDQINVQGGLSLTYNLDDVSDEDIDSSSTSIGFLVGAAYSVNDNFYAQVRYIPQLTDSASDPDFSVKTNVLSFTIGYNL